MNLKFEYISLFSTLRILIHTSSVVCKINPKNAKSGSSNQWLRRQLNDPYVELARTQNYRCRSAFKLLEIDKIQKLFTPGQCVIDCGASPGSWTQVAVEKTNANNKNPNLPVGFVISIDKQPIHSIRGAVLLGSLDFTTDAALSKLNETLNGKKVDVVLSDMAPKASGIKFLDHDRIVELASSALRFAVQVSSVGGSVLLKLWDGGSTKELKEEMIQYYKTVHFIKPKSSRSDSAEIFMLGKEFKGLKTKS